jgi:hypothetical protein
MYNMQRCASWFNAHAEQTSVALFAHRISRSASTARSIPASSFATAA